MLQARWNRGCDSKTLSRLRVARLIPRPTPTCSQYRFKSKGARGKQVSKYILPSAVARVKKLIENVESIERAGPKDRREALPRIFVIQGERGRATLLPGKKRTHSLPFASGRSSPCLRLMPRKAIKWPACSG